MQTPTIASSETPVPAADPQRRLLTWLEELQLRNELADLSRRVRKRPLVLFFGRNSFSDNTKYLFLRAAAAPRGYEVLWCTPSAELAAALRAQNLPVLLLGEEPERSIDLLMHAAVAVFTLNPLHSVGVAVHLLGCLAGAVQLQLWHGVSVKRLNLQLLPHLDARIADLRVFWQANCGADHVLSTASHFDTYWREVFGCRSLLRAGLPRNEVILRPARGLEWLGAGLPERTVAALETDAPAILVVPTWQRSKTTALTDAAFLALTLQFARQTGSQIYFKAHPTHMGQWGGDAARGGIDGLHLIDPGVDIYPWLHRFDALVTDYSSILFDFLLTARPVLTLDFGEAAHQSYEPDWCLVPAGEFRTPFAADRIGDALLQALTADRGAQARGAYAESLFETDPLRASDTLLGALDELVERALAPDHRVWAPGAH